MVVFDRFGTSFPPVHKPPEHQLKMWEAMHVGFHPLSQLEVLPQSCQPRKIDALLRDHTMAVDIDSRLKRRTKMPSKNSINPLKMSLTTRKLEVTGTWFAYIKTRKTASGPLELFGSLSGIGETLGPSDTIAVLPLGPNEADNGYFQIVGDYLYFIRTRKALSGTTEIHRLTAASHWRTFDVHTTTIYTGSLNDQNGTFHVDSQNLWYIKYTGNTSGMIEIYMAHHSTEYRSMDFYATTCISDDERDNGQFFVRNGIFYFVKIRNTDSGMVELYRSKFQAARRNSNGPEAGIYYSHDYNGFDVFLTPFGSGEDGNGYFDLDIAGNLFFIKLRNVSNPVGMIECHEARSLNGYATSRLGVTSIPVSENDNGRFMIASRTELLATS